MVLPRTKLHFTAEEYLAFERAAEMKHEYLDGQIYAMAGASPQHNQICFNLAGELRPQLKGRPCRGFSSDQKTSTDPADLFSYPDLTIVCGEPKFHDEQQDVMLNPTVIIEVLSPTTEAYDRGEKFARYRQLKSLSDYILVAQDKACIEHYIRQPGKRPWLYIVETDLSAKIWIASIKCELKLADVYDLVEFPPQKAPMFAVKDRLIEPKPSRSLKRKVIK